MDENEDIAEYNIWITWSKAHFRVTAGSSETKLNPVRKSARNEKYVTSCSECLLFLCRTPYIMANFQPQVKYFHII